MNRGGGGFPTLYGYRVQHCRAKHQLTCGTRMRAVGSRYVTLYNVREGRETRNYGTLRVVVQLVRSVHVLSRVCVPNNKSRGGRRRSGPARIPKHAPVTAPSQALIHQQREHDSTTGCTGCAALCLVARFVVQTTVAAVSRATTACEQEPCFHPSAPSPPSLPFALGPWETLRPRIASRWAVGGH